VDEARGLVKYAKPAGVIASLIPMTNPAMTPPVASIYSAKARNAVIFSPHPRTAQTTCEMTEVMRAGCRAVGAPEDLFQSNRKPSIPLTQHLMEICDLTRATSGKPALGVGAGNSSIVIDETADIDIAAASTRMSKTPDFGSGCSADGNIIIQKSSYDRMVAALQTEGDTLIVRFGDHMVRIGAICEWICTLLPLWSFAQAGAGEQVDQEGQIFRVSKGQVSSCGSKRVERVGFVKTGNCLAGFVGPPLGGISGRNISKGV
jgi:acyl-CoA reductase-like NAD-dependent aldehyde dehydrogenase